MNKPDLEKARREANRWFILQCLDSARPMGAGETLVMSALAGVTQMTHNELRRELDYLEERELIEVTGKDSPYWHSKLTRVGVDLVEYTIPCEPGIARPQKYW